MTVARRCLLLRLRGGGSAVVEVRAPLVSHDVADLRASELTLEASDDPREPIVKVAASASVLVSAPMLVAGMAVLRHRCFERLTGRQRRFVVGGHLAILLPDMPKTIRVRTDAAVALPQGASSRRCSDQSTPGASRHPGVTTGRLFRSAP